MRRFLGVVVTFAVLALGMPALALAHDQPETSQSRWVMADWMMDAFFIFSGFALIVFLTAWKLGHFRDLDQAATIPLYVDEEEWQ